MDARVPLENGRVILLKNKIYTIREMIGCGSNALVYKAQYDDSLIKNKTHTVILKELFPYNSKGLITRNELGAICVQEEARKSFEMHKESFERGNSLHLDLQEARADITDVNIDSCEENNTLYSVLEYSNGQTLKDIIKNNNVERTFLDIIALINGLLVALKAFHDSGFLHLDISPDNILVFPHNGKSEETRRIVLIDYNSAWSINDNYNDRDVYYSVKECYTAPEVRMKERRDVSTASDIFSVCAIFYEMLAGETLDYSSLYRTGKATLPKSDIFDDAPATARLKAASIINKGLKLPPKKRYQSTSEFSTDLKELSNRIKGLGVTHAALWEESHAGFSRHIEKNPGYQYLFSDEKLLPCNVNPNVSENNGFLLSSGAGMGKTTALLLLWKKYTQRYEPTAPVPVYIPLYNYEYHENSQFIHSRILERLKFTSETLTAESAKKALDSIFDTPLKNNGVSVLLMLDGFNEISGDTSGLISEINELISKQGVSIILTSRAENDFTRLPVVSISPLSDLDIAMYLKNNGVLYPSDKKTQEILKNPMMLSIYAQTGQTLGIHEISNAEQLLDSYMESLLKVHKLSFIADETAHLQAEFVLSFVLPLMAHEMKIRGKQSLTPLETEKTVERCFSMLKDKQFFKLFPKYHPHSEKIKNNAKSSKEWYENSVYKLLCRQFALIQLDENYGLRFSHQNFLDYFTELYKKRFSDYFRAKKIRSIKVSLPICMGLLMIFGAVLWQVVVSKQRIEIVKSALSVIGVSLVETENKMNRDLLALEKLEESHSTYLDYYEKNKSGFELKDPIYTNKQISDFIQSAAKLPEEAFRASVNAPYEYGKLSEAMHETLNAILSDSVLYSGGLTNSAIELYREQILAFANIYCANLQLVFISLDNHQKQEGLKLLTYSSLLKERFLNLPMAVTAENMNTLINMEKENISQITMKLYGLGIK